VDRPVAPAHLAPAGDLAGEDRGDLGAREPADRVRGVDDDRDAVEGDGDLVQRLLGVLEVTRGHADLRRAGLGRAHPRRRAAPWTLIERPGWVPM